MAAWVVFFVLVFERARLAEAAVIVSLFLQCK